MTTHPSPLDAPPPVADRRAPDRRSQPDPHSERNEVLRQAAAAFIAFSGGIAFLFVFFAGIGTVNLSDAGVATLVACGLALVWAGGILYTRRHEEFRSKRNDRERRGF